MFLKLPHKFLSLTCKYHRKAGLGHSSPEADQWSEMTRAWSRPRSGSASRVCPHPASSVTSRPRGRPWGTLCSNCTSGPSSLMAPSPGTLTSTCGRTSDTDRPRGWAAPRPGLRTEAAWVSADLLHHWPGDISSCPSWGSLMKLRLERSAGRHVSPPSHSAANWQLKAGARAERRWYYRVQPAMGR